MAPESAPRNFQRDVKRKKHGRMTPVALAHPGRTALRAQLAKTKVPIKAKDHNIRATDEIQVVRAVGGMNQPAKAQDRKSDAWSLIRPVGETNQTCQSTGTIQIHQQTSYLTQRREERGERRETGSSEHSRSPRPPLAISRDLMGSTDPEGFVNRTFEFGFWAKCSSQRDRAIGQGLGPNRCVPAEIAGLLC